MNSGPPIPRFSAALLAAGVLAAFSSAHAGAFGRQQRTPSLFGAVDPTLPTGKGVIVAILDRGIQWQNPDFITPDGHTRIKWLLDMSGQSYCSSSNPPPVEYSAAQIDAALQNGTPLDERDAVGHGTATAGLAAGNGRAYASGKYKGLAPEADLIVVKLVSEGAPAHGNEAAEQPFVGCYSDALDWVNQKAVELGEPMVALINSGVQLWGPTDGTSALSRKIDQVFGDQPGRIFVSPAGDEGGLPTHAGGSYADHATSISLSRRASTDSQVALWYSGLEPAEVTVDFDDGASLGPIRPGEYAQQNGISIIQYDPGQEFYPAASSSGDHLVLVEISGHATTGHMTIDGLTPGVGRFDVYSDASVGSDGTFDPITAFTDHLVPGRLTDQSSTKSVIVVGSYVGSNAWVDIDGTTRQLPADIPGDLWTGSASGPTRDNRMGIDLAAPGENTFASYATNSYWATFRSNLVQDGGGYYGRFGATSAAAPIVAGAIADLLEMQPGLSADQVRQLLHESATSDGQTGATPNDSWGYGKLNLGEALIRLTATHATARPFAR